MLSTILIAAALIGLPLVPIMRYRAARQATGSTRPALPGTRANNARRSSTNLLVLRTGPGGCSCAASRQFSGKTFDRASAPKLPLASCARADCECRFEAIADRRRNPRRMSADRRDLIRFATKSDRRISTDRRRLNAVWESHSL